VGLGVQRTNRALGLQTFEERACGQTALFQKHDPTVEQQDDRVRVHFGPSLDLPDVFDRWISIIRAQNCWATP
jgi:hypothetical protein